MSWGAAGQDGVIPLLHLPPSEVFFLTTRWRAAQSGLQVRRHSLSQTLQPLCRTTIKPPTEPSALHFIHSDSRQLFFIGSKTKAIFYTFHDIKQSCHTVRNKASEHFLTILDKSIIIVVLLHFHTISSLMTEHCHTNKIPP